MAFEKIVFYTFAAILVFAATRVITVRNPVHAALHLVLAFFTSAGLWILLEAEFLAITLVLVYVGAVMVLFLFVGMTVAGLMILEMYLVVQSKYFDAEHMPTPSPRGADYSNTRELGSVLYTEFVYPFEIAAVILLVAIIAVIVIFIMLFITLFLKYKHLYLLLFSI